MLTEMSVIFISSHFFLPIAGVHDSYWTHACDVDEMNRILREKFVELYEIPILENVKYLSGTCLRSISFLSRRLAVVFCPFLCLLQEASYYIILKRVNQHLPSP